MPSMRGIRPAPHEKESSPQMLSFSWFRGRLVYSTPDIFYKPPTVEWARLARTHRDKEAAGN